MTGGAGWTIVRLAVTAAVLAWALRGVDAGAAADALSRIGWPHVAAALGLAACDRLLMLRRWQMLIRPFTDLTDRALVRIFFVSSFLGSFLPAGVGGDAARAFSVSRHAGQAGPAVASVLVDRWLGLLAVALSGSAGLLLVITALPSAARAFVMAGTAILVAGSIAGVFADRLMERLCPAGLRHTWPGRMAWRLAAALGAYRAHHGILGRVAMLSLVVQAVRIVLAWVIGRGLGIDLPFSYYWVFMPVNILVILLPLSLGGFGLPQGAMIWTLEPFGVPATPAFLLSTLFVGIGIIGNLPGAWMYAVGPRRRPAAPRGTT